MVGNELFIKNSKSLSIMSGLSCLSSLVVLCLIGFTNVEFGGFSWPLIIVLIVLGLFSLKQAALFWKDNCLKAYNSNNNAVVSVFYSFTAMHVMPVAGFFFSAFVIYHLKLTA
ncbi:TPA: hypothetical protein I7E69_001862 [Vibrio cholerae]|nr:hypothetical protein [Vibrio cholerae]